MLIRAVLLAIALSFALIKPAFALVKPAHANEQESALEQIHFATVIDGKIYRGGRPKLEGMKALKAIGVKTIIGLQGGDHNDHTPFHWILEAASPGERPSRYNQEAADANSLGLDFVWEPLAAVIFYTSKITWREDGIIEDALKVMNDPHAYPIYVHCTKGRDRSGLLVALFRVQHGWSVERAHAEWVASGHRGITGWVTRTLDKYFYIKAQQIIDRGH